MAEHRTKTIARTPRCRVDQCSCGAVHVTTGGTTVRIDASTARELRDVMVQAIMHIDRNSQVVQAPYPNAVAVKDRKDDDDPTLH